MPTTRMTREERKAQIMCVLLKNEEGGGAPLSCRQIAHAMGMSGFSYINSILQEMCDDNLLNVNVHPSNKAISNVRFEYYV